MLESHDHIYEKHYTPDRRNVPVFYIVIDIVIKHGLKQNDQHCTDAYISFPFSNFFNVVTVYKRGDTNFALEWLVESADQRFLG